VNGTDENSSLLSFLWFRALLSVVGVLLVLCCYGLAQVANEEAGSSETSIGNASDNYSSDKPDANSAILKELEQMRQRIQELETKLQQSHSSRETGESPRANATNSVVSPTSVANGSEHMADTEAKKPPKAEPFAFADWTWLNGNARTKSAAFDSTFLPQRFAPTSTTSMTLITPKTTRSADQVKYFVRAKYRSRNWVLAVIFTTTMFAHAS